MRKLLAIASVLACVTTAQASDRPAECNGIPWCGCYLRLKYGETDKALNKASNWRFWGRPAPRDCTDCVAVWGHHVGKVTGRPDKGTIILLSGNTRRKGHSGVVEAPRSSRGVIAYRYPL